ncbi:MAG: hypothetical protein IJ943_08205 [Akkermansia sp.]|nr:hypothetical protein [Akkermansia sp.]
MKNSVQFSAIAAAAVGCVLSSCVYHSNPVPEMPYKPRTQQPVPQPPALSQAPGVWAPAVQQPLAPGYTAVLSPTPARPATPTARPTVTPATPAARPAAPAAPAPAVRPTAPAAPAPAVRPAPAPAGSHITQSYTPPAPVPAATPAPTAPAPAMQPPVVSTVTPPTPSGATNTPTDPKLITNTGPIPVATRVEGDPIRVYNPLDPTKTIRIIDPKTGKVHPSGKVLKVKGTNFKFIVP